MLSCWGAWNLNGKSELNKPRIDAFLVAGRLATGLALFATISGCASIRNRIETVTANSIGAEPISIDDVNALEVKVFQDADKPPSDTQLTALAIIDSEQKCTAFKRRLSSGERAFDTVGDVSSGILSALGAVFTPASTVRAFSAAATIVTGIKTAVDADIYAKFTAPLIIQALNKTYDVDIARELTIVAKPDGVADFSAALANLASIHDECSLDRATTYLTQQNETLRTSSSSSQSVSGKIAPSDGGGIPNIPTVAATPQPLGTDRSNTVIRPTALPPAEN